MSKNSAKRRIKHLGAMLFVIYILLLIYFLFFSEEYGRVAAEERIYRYNLIPFVEIRRFWIYREQLGVFAVITNLLGNVIGFIPYGFILPVIARKCRSGFFIILSGFGLSLLVETIQLITKVGCFDVDDLILNTLGAALGYLAFAVCNYLRRNHYGKKI
nr:VanZ family protein [uncultured Blautia sp.]